VLPGLALVTLLVCLAVPVSLVLLVTLLLGLALPLLVAPVLGPLLVLLLVALPLLAAVLSLVVLAALRLGRPALAATLLPVFVATFLPTSLHPMLALLCLELRLFSVRLASVLVGRIVSTHNKYVGSGPLPDETPKGGSARRRQHTVGVTPSTPVSDHPGPTYACSQRRIVTWGLDSIRFTSVSFTTSRANYGPGRS